MITARRLRLPAAALLVVPFMSGAALAQTLRVEGITIEGPGGSRVEIPEIIATDSSLDEAGIRALFGTDYAVALAGLLDLDAAEIRIPTITIVGADLTGTERSATPAATTAEVTYRDLVLTAVEGGVATRGARLGATEIDTGDDATFAFAPMSVGYLDLVTMLGLYGVGPRAATAETEMTRVYGDFRLDGITFGDDSFNCDIGPATAEELRGRPLQHTLNDLIEAMQQLEHAEQGSLPPPAQAVHTIVSYYVDFLTAFESTPTTIDGLACSGTTEDGDGIRVALGGASFDGFAPGIYPGLAINELGIETDDGWMRLGNFTWKPTDISQPIAAIRAAAAPIDANWFEENWRKLIPAIEGFSLSDFAMDIPSPENGGERLTASVGAVDVTLGAYVNGIPSAVSTHGADIVIEVPEGEDGALFRAMGLEALSLGYDLIMHWNEADSTISVDQVAIGGYGLGLIELSGTLANAGPDLFADDPDAALAAAMGLTVRDLRLELVNTGLLPALLAVAAADQGTPPNVMAAQFVAVARALPIGILGATDEALGLSRALSGFLSGTPGLTITLTAVDPAGVPWAVFVAAQENPEVLKDQFTIDAVAEGEAVPFVFPEIAAPSPPQVQEAPGGQNAPEGGGSESESESQEGAN